MPPAKIISSFSLVSLTKNGSKPCRHGQGFDTHSHDTRQMLHKKHRHWTAVLVET